MTRSIIGARLFCAPRARDGRERRRDARTAAMIAAVVIAAGRDRSQRDLPGFVIIASVDD